MPSTYQCPRCNRVLPKDDNYNPMTGSCRVCAVAEPTTQPTSAGVGQPEGERGLGGLCVTVGLILVVLGLYFLLQPGVAVEGARGMFPGGVVNLQRLTLGEALMISGSVFLAAAWRPR